MIEAPTSPSPSTAGAPASEDSTPGCNTAPRIAASEPIAACASVSAYEPAYEPAEAALGRSR
ncbi:hypothetical protein [Nonomuraea ceibae]|uniref:hypothetical protein n=1 Tax=Nonomuraea ceibae TaxID=1935170 RepID=UPI001C5F441A|nr:hypothetical protein [Nonomuraea ceibae]